VSSHYPTGTGQMVCCGPDVGLSAGVLVLVVCCWSACGAATRKFKGLPLMVFPYVVGVYPNAK